MSDLDYDLDLNSSEQEFVQDSASDFISTMKTSINSINSNPPFLTTYTENSENLNNIAVNFHEIMASTRINEFNSETRNIIEKGICAFIYEMNRIREEKEKCTLKEIETRKENEIISIKEENEQLKKENNQLKEDAVMLYSTNSQISKKLNSIQRETETEILDMKDKNSLNEENIRSLQRTIKNNEILKSKIESQLKESKEEKENLKNEIIVLKNKLKAKSNSEEEVNNAKLNLEIQIHELETENQKLNVSINNYKQLLEKAKLQIDQSDTKSISDYEDENKKYHDSVMKTFEYQANYISDLQSINNSQRAILSKSLKIVDTYDNQLVIYEKEVDQLRQDNTEINGSLEIATAELEKAKKCQEQINKIKKICGIEFCEDDDESELFEIIKNSVSQTQTVSNEKVQILYMLIENQIKFLTNLITTNQIDLFTLTNKDPNEPLTDDEETKNQILMELARVRQFLRQNGLTPENEDPNNSSLSAGSINANANRVIDASDSNIDPSKLTQDRELLDFVSSLILQSRTVQDYCEKLKAQSSKNMSVIQEIINGIEYDDRLEDLPAVVLNNIISLTDTIEEIKKIVEEDNNSELLDTIQTMSTVYHQVNKNVRELIAFKGEPASLPKAIEQYIDSLIEDNRVQLINVNERNKKKIEKIHYELENNFNLMKNENNDLKIKLKKLSQELLSKADKLNASEKEAENLNSQIEELTKKQNESLSRMKESISNYADLQNDHDRLKEENKKIRDLISQKVEETENRFNSIIEEEKQVHSKEIESFKNNQKQREEKLIEKLKKTQEKYHLVKDKLKEVMTVYEKAFKKQKAAVTQIKNRNDELVEELSNARKDKPNINDKYHAENMRLNFNLKSLEFEKQNLNTRIEQLTEKCAHIQNARDNYWQLQLSIKEGEYQKKESVLIQNQNSFIQRIIAQISSYVSKPIEISEDYVIKTMKLIATRIEDDEFLISSLQAELSKPSNFNYPNFEGSNGFNSVNSLAESEAETVDKSDSLDQWQKWAREMYSCTMDGEVYSQSDHQLRNILGELIIASISQRDLVKKLKSLRIQKNLLLRNVPLNSNPKSKRPLLFKVLCIVVLASKRIFTKNNVSLSLLKK